jgi:predicted metal-dependent peptidase
MIDIMSRNNDHRKLLICIYTNKDKNEFAIGLKEDENFRAMTKVGEFYTKFVDAFDQIIDKNEIDWKHELKRWIAAAKKNETIFVEVDLSSYNNEVEDLSCLKA